MSAVVASIMAAIVGTVLTVWLKWRDKKKKEALNVKIHPNSGRALSKFRDWVQHKQSDRDL